MISQLVLVTTAVTLMVSGFELKPAKTQTRRHDFSPRMDYDEWTPLGRGDPLKNDPTYDYMPPVLDRVHYWVDPKKRTPDPPIAVSSATTEPTTAVTATSRLGSFTLLDPFFKFMDRTKSVIASANSFRPTPTTLHYSPIPYPLHGKVHQHHSESESVDLMPPPLVSQESQAMQRPPYTMLMPPPPPQLLTSTESPATSFATSTKTTTRVYDLTSQPILETTMVSEDSTTTPTPTPHKSYTTTIVASENLYKPVAITMPESISNETNEETLTTVMTTGNDKGMTIPVFTLFNEDTNQLQDDERKRPNEEMFPPPAEYFGFLPTTVRTTTVQTLTTDPMFKHYKQPSKPARGPFYLIIQGHSKVKTYGASKNKLTPLSINDIDDSKMLSYEDYESGTERKAKKLTHADIQEEVIEGHPTFELAASFKTKHGIAFSVSDSGNKNSSKVSKRAVGRKLLAKTETKQEEQEEDDLGLESFIALNDDYNSDDVLNLLFKQQGQGSGIGGIVSSLFSRSFNVSDEI